MENNFFCTKPVINVLLEPKKSSKVSSQLIYGEKFQIISRRKNYIKVKNFYDRYIGYIKFNNFRSNYKPTHKVVCLKSRIYLQKKGKTIQGRIQNAISKILKEKINIIGSGRTDSGVHALEQSAHFDTNTKIKDSYKFLKSVNHFLSRYSLSLIHI